MKHPHLFSPLAIGHLWVPNRVVIPAMHSNLAAPDGSVTEAMIRHYTTRARGGAGLVIVEVAVVASPLGRQSLTSLNIDHPRYVSGLSRLADAVKAEGAAVFLQLFHSGAQTAPLITDGLTPVSPSGVPVRVMGITPRVLRRDEIKQLVRQFIEAGTRAAAAGFDGVELHAAHGYLLSEFLSPLTNQRQDAYGGSREHRVQIMREIISGIKERCPDLLVSVRINGDDFLPGGIEREESAALARLLSEAGADLLNVSAGMYDSGLTSIESNVYPEGWRLYLSGAIKKAVSVPVIGGGVIHDPAQADQAIASGLLDLVYVGRATLADPEWPRKALAGTEAEIRPCIRCNTCIASNLAGLPTHCAVNPQMGRNIPVNIPGEPSRVLVIGGGPAGMMAALTARQQGHRVTLVDKGELPGGLLHLASLPPHKERIAIYRDYLLGQLQKAGVILVTNREADAEWIRQQDPEVLLLALGSRPRPLPLQYNDGSIPELSLEEALQNGGSPGQTCLVAGGGETGLEVAQVLGLHQNRVVVIEASAVLAAHMERKNRRSLLTSLKDLPVEFRTLTRVIGIEKGKAHLVDARGESVVAGDYLVAAVGREPEPVPEEWLTLALRVRVIGDGMRPATIAQAVFSGWAAGRSI